MLFRRIIHIIFVGIFCPFLCIAAQSETSDSATSIMAGPAYSVLLVNDNYIATWLPGEKGNYFGADFEWALTGSKPYISVSAGGHMQGDFGLDGTLNLNN